MSYLFFQVNYVGIFIDEQLAFFFTNLNVRVVQHTELCLKQMR